MKVVWATFFTAIFVLLAYFQIWQRSVPPTDDMLYIDAAVSYQQGSYVPPSKDKPQHHYLRWPVFMPLAIWSKFFAYSVFSLKAYLTLQSLVLFILSYLVVSLFFKKDLEDKLVKSSKYQPLLILAAFTPLLLPAEILSERVLSEPISLNLILLASCLSLFGVEKKKKIFIFLSGLIAAISLFASLINIFIVFLPLILALIYLANSNKNTYKFLFQITALYLLGLVIGCLGGLGVETLLLSGDPFLRLKVIQWWHIHYLSPKISIIDRFFTLDNSYFILGFLRNTFIHYPLFFISLFFFAALTFFSKAKSAKQLVATFTLIVLLYELLAQFAVEKIYIRFLAIVFSVFLTYFIAAAFLYSNKFSKVIAIVAFMALFYVRIAETRERDFLTAYFKEPITALYQDWQNSASDRAEKIKIVTYKRGEQWLIPYELLIKVYTHYQIPHVHHVREFEKLRSNPTKTSYFIGPLDRSAHHLGLEDKIIYEGNADLASINNFNEVVVIRQKAASK